MSKHRRVVAQSVIPETNMWNILIAFVALLCASSAAAAPDVIKPGMSLKEVQSTLKRHDYKFGEEYALAMVARDKDADLMFCKIDSDVVLIVVYKKSTGIVASMSVNFFPEKPTPKMERLVASRQARRIVFDEEGAFTVSLERVFRKTTGDKTKKEPVDLFGF